VGDPEFNPQHVYTHTHTHTHTHTPHTHTVSRNLHVTREPWEGWEMGRDRDKVI
jgi:hypothetical protein